MCASGWRNIGRIIFRHQNRKIKFYFDKNNIVPKLPVLASLIKRAKLKKKLKCKKMHPNT